MRIVTAISLAVLLSSNASAADLPEDFAYQPDTPAVSTDAQSALGDQTFAACQKAITEWAEPFAPVDIQTVRAGPVRKRLFGERVAPLFVQIVYDTEGGLQTRKANVDCTVGRNDRVAVKPVG